MEELRRYPPFWEGDSVQAAVLRSGEAAFLPTLTAEILAGQANGEDHASVARLLAAGSAICAPLVVRGRRLGTLSFLYADSGRRYSPAEEASGRDRPTAAPVLVVQVEDSGVGIAADELPRIFDAFERGRNTAEALGGLGLGLAISRSIVDLHGGRLGAASGGRGQGATLSVRLPLEIADRGRDAATGAGRGAAAAQPPGAVVHSGVHILLIEDHADTSAAMARLLVQMGHRVTVAETVSESLAVAAAGGIDLVVSDLGLPDGDGYQVMRALAGTGVPGIALSGYGMEEDVAKSRESGFSFHLTKPVNLETLREAIHSAIGSGAEKR